MPEQTHSERETQSRDIALFTNTTACVSMGQVLAARS